MREKNKERQKHRETDREKDGGTDPDRQRHTATQKQKTREAKRSAVWVPGEEWNLRDRATERDREVGRPDRKTVRRRKREAMGQQRNNRET